MTVTIAESFMRWVETFGRSGGLTAHIDPEPAIRRGLGGDMVFDLIAMLSGEWFYSPFIIPVAGCAMILGIVASGAWARVRTLEIRSQERLARIAHGLPVEPDWHEATVKAGMAGMQAASSSPGPAVVHGHMNDGGKARRAGIVLSSIGTGLLLFFVLLAMITRERGVLIAALAGILPLAIGIGFLVDARLKRQEYGQYLMSGPVVGQGAWGGAISPGGSAPPPPPAGMTPAQASDWRPSSSTLK